MREIISFFYLIPLINFARKLSDSSKLDRPTFRACCSFGKPRLQIIQLKCKQPITQDLIFVYFTLRLSWNYSWSQVAIVSKCKGKGKCACTISPMNGVSVCRSTIGAKWWFKFDLLPRSYKKGKNYQFNLFLWSMKKSNLNYFNLKYSNS